MLYLLRDASLLFTVLLLASTTVLVSLFAAAHFIIAGLKKRKAKNANMPAQGDRAFPTVCCPGQEAPCCAGQACASK